MTPRTMLRILLVITFMFAGLSALSYLMMAVMGDALATYYENQRDLFPAEIYTAMERLFTVPRSFFALSSLLYLVEVVGGVYMWKERSIGFHLYTLARLVLLLLPPLFLGGGAIGIGDVMFALLYIGIYFFLLKRLGAFGGASDIGKQDDATEGGASNGDVGEREDA